MPRVLHILSQRPSMTGSGVTLDALVRHAAAAGWEQCVVAGVPAGEPLPDVGGLHVEKVKPLFFGAGGLPFPVPGMSDVMPYASTRFSDMTPAMIDAYRTAWKQHVQSVIESFGPHVIHSHHVWILGSLLKDVAPDTPVVTHCHATGLRQMELCPHLAGGVKQGCSRNERFAVLHGGHAAALVEALGISAERVSVVGAGFREELFHAHARRARGAGNAEADRRNRLLYTGKYAAAKGLPWLLDAVERLAVKNPGIELHVAGTGTGPEADALRGRMESMAPLVRLHGQVGQPELAGLMRQSAVCVLPSFFEGLPLVLVEALACGCRLVSTALPGVVEQLALRLGPALDLVPLPRLEGVDRPAAADLPAFVDALAAALESALEKPPLDDPAVAMPGALQAFTWKAVFERVEALWRELIEASGQETVL